MSASWPPRADPAPYSAIADIVASANGALPERIIVQKPSIGRIVHYTLGEGDVALINQHHPQVVNGRQVRNSVKIGDVLPAQVVAVFPGATVCNLKVSLDGEGEYWATSRQEGEGKGFWTWPPRVS